MFLFLALLTTAYAADDAALTLVIKAQAAYDRVEAQPFANVTDTARCAQSQAELLPLSRPVELPLVRFRKGYCELLEAGLTGDRASYLQAAQDFAQAMAAWPVRTPEPVSAGIQVLSAIARLKAGPDAATVPGIRAGLDQALASRLCPASVMSARLCHELLDAGRVWQGWLMMQENDLRGAAAVFNEFPNLGWADWTAGRQAMGERRYPQAAASLGRAVEAWTNQQKYPKAGAVHTLGPAPDLGAALVDLGGARYLAKDYAGAINALDTAIKSHPEDAQAWFLRGLAREALGQAQAGLEDFQLASRTAFAHPDRPFASSRAHFYRGIWHFRRKAWTQAEDEFSAALNSDPGPAFQADVTAWRQMAAVAGGACDLSASGLVRSLAQTSDFFPRNDAEALLAACRARPQNISQK